MLILTRRIGETIIINDNIKCLVLGIRGNQVRLGIEAPSDVTVHREEIFLRIQREKLEGKTEFEEEDSEDTRGNVIK